MNEFPSAREAKEFLVSRIVEEAQRENVPISDIEQKMLYFSETAATLPDMMDISDKFDRTYDQDKYEKKMSLLVRNAGKRTNQDSPEEYARWWSAIRLLKKEDHYIIVLIRNAGLRPPGDQRRLLGAGLALAIFLCGVIGLAKFVPGKFDLGKYATSRNTLVFGVWAGAAGIAIGYTILRMAFGARKFDAWMDKVFLRLFRISERGK